MAKMKRNWCLLAAGLLAVATPFVAWGQAGKSNGRKLAPPPKWDSRLLKLFFADATKHVGPGQPGSARPATGTVAGGASTPGGTAAAPAGGDGFAWSKLIDAETLEGEIKTNINALATTVDNPGKFKTQNFRKARASYSSLAMLFGVVANYDGDVKWKDKAPGLREAVAKAGFNCKVGSEQSFGEAKSRYEDLRSLLEGGSPKLPEAEPAAEWPKVADRSELMKRMEEAGQAHLTPWTASEGEFKANQEEVLREAQLLAVMAHVIQQPGFDYADDENYQKYAGDLEQASVEMADAAKQSNFEKARAAAGNMAKACANCHTDFR